MERITTAQLEGIVKQVNLTQGQPLEAWTKHSNGTYYSNVGNYHLDWAYSGVALCQMVNTAGGVRHITPGFSTKRECYYQIRAYLEGIRDRVDMEVRRSA